MLELKTEITRLKMHLFNLQTQVLYYNSLQFSDTFTAKAPGVLIPKFLHRYFCDLHRTD